MTKALVCSMNTNVGPYSYLQKLYGDPDDYAYQFGNHTFAKKLPIHLKWMYNRKYDFFHSVSIDYETQRVYYSNHANERLEYGLYVYNNRTTYYYYYAVPETNQVNNRTLNITISTCSTD